MTAAGTGQWHYVVYENLPACQGLITESSSCLNDRRVAMSLSKNIPFDGVNAIVAVTANVCFVFPILEEWGHVRREPGMRITDREPAAAKDIKQTDDPLDDRCIRRSGPAPLPSFSCEIAG